MLDSSVAVPFIQLSTESLVVILSLAVLTVLAAASVALCASCRKSKFDHLTLLYATRQDPVLTHHASVSPDAALPDPEMGNLVHTGSSTPHSQEKVSSAQLVSVTPHTEDTTNGSGSRGNGPSANGRSGGKTHDSSGLEAATIRHEKENGTPTPSISLSPPDSGHHYDEIGNVVKPSVPDSCQPQAVEKDSRTSSKKKGGFFLSNRSRKEKEEKSLKKDRDDKLSPKEKQRKSSKKHEKTSNDESNELKGEGRQRSSSLTPLGRGSETPGGGSLGRSSISPNRAQSTRNPGTTGRQLPEIPLPPPPSRPVPLPPGGGAQTDDTYDHINFNVNVRAEKAFHEAHVRKDRQSKAQETSCAGQGRMPAPPPPALQQQPQRVKIKIDEEDYATIGGDSAGSVGVSAAIRAAGEEDVYAEPDSDLASGLRAGIMSSQAGGAQHAHDSVYDYVVDCEATRAESEMYTTIPSECHHTYSAVGAGGPLGHTYSSVESPPRFNQENIITNDVSMYATVSDAVPKMSEAGATNSSAVSPPAAAVGDSRRVGRPVHEYAKVKRTDGRESILEVLADIEDSREKTVGNSQAGNSGVGGACNPSNHGEAADDAEDPVYADPPRVPDRLYSSSEEDLEEGEDAAGVHLLEGAGVAEVAEPHGSAEEEEEGEEGLLDPGADDYDELNYDGGSSVPPGSGDSAAYDEMTVRKSRRLMEAEANEEVVYEEMDEEGFARTRELRASEELPSVLVRPNSSGDVSLALHVTAVLASNAGLPSNTNPSYRVVPTEPGRMVGHHTYDSAETPQGSRVEAQGNLNSEVNQCDDHTYESADETQGLIPGTNLPTPAELARRKANRPYDEVDDFQSMKPGPGSPKRSENNYDNVNLGADGHKASFSSSDDALDSVPCLEEKVTLVYQPPRAGPAPDFSVRRRLHEYQEIDEVRRGAAADGAAADGAAADGAAADGAAADGAAADGAAADGVAADGVLQPEKGSGEKVESSSPTDSLEKVGTNSPHVNSLNGRAEGDISARGSSPAVAIRVTEDHGDFPGSTEHLVRSESESQISVRFFESEGDDR